MELNEDEYVEWVECPLCKCEEAELTACDLFCPECDSYIDEGDAPWFFGCRPVKWWDDPLARETSQDEIDFDDDDENESEEEE